MFRATPCCRSAGQHRINCLRFFSFLSCSLVERKAQQAATHPTNLRQASHPNCVLDSAKGLIFTFFFFELFSFCLNNSVMLPNF
jgi:hypothetical protein